jgi:hypothetical protein
VSVNELQLRGGGFYANNHYGLDRVVSFPGFYQTAGSGYGGDTAEVFGEAGWRIGVAAPFVSAASVEPFVGVAGVDLHTASFTETPGTASLVAVVIFAIAMPPLNEVPEGFPAVVLWQFRMASLGAQVIMWTVLGLGLGAWVERDFAEAKVGRLQTAY